MADEGVRDIIDELVQTKEAAGVLVRILDESIEQIYIKDAPIEKKLEKIFPAQKFEQIELLMQKHMIDWSNKEQVVRFLTSLKKALLRRPVLHVTLAFEANKDTYISIRNWSHKNFGGTPLLDISLDSSIIGGCILQVDGYYKDYSVRSMLEEKRGFLLERFINA